MFFLHLFVCCFVSKLTMLVNCDMSATYKIDLLPTRTTLLGEGPHWDVDTQSLYFVDINDASVHRFDYAENRTYSAKIQDERYVAFIIPVDGERDQFAVGLGRRVGIIRWDGIAANVELLRIAFTVEPDERYSSNRLNDAKADPAGRWFGGTMRQEECAAAILGNVDGSFYRYASGDKVATQLKSGVGVSNGLAWNLKTKRFYYIDSCALNVKEFDYDIKTGEISNERVLVDFRPPNGEEPTAFPDGMTIDSNGFLYVATWGGSKIQRIDPNSRKIVSTIELPALQITSAAFGGPNLDILYVTSAAFQPGAKDLPPHPKPAGAVFAVSGLGVRGLPMNKVRL